MRAKAAPAQGICSTAGRSVLTRPERRKKPRASRLDNVVDHTAKLNGNAPFAYRQAPSKPSSTPPASRIDDLMPSAVQRSGRNRIIGLFKTEAINRLGAWRNVSSVAYPTLQWMDWFNNRRLPLPISNIPPAEAEVRYLQQP